MCFFAKPISIAKFVFLQPIRMEHFSFFFSLQLGGQNLATGWAIWTTGWAFCRSADFGDTQNMSDVDALRMILQVGRKPGCVETVVSEFD